MDIKYTKNTKQAHFIGRNGYFKQSGLVVQAHEGEMVVIMPLTSRGVTGNCMMDIPLEDVPSVIDALQKSAKLPTHGLVKTLTDTELCIIFEAARTALADGEVFDSLGEKMDLNDGVMKEIQEKLEGIMSIPPLEDHRPPAGQNGLATSGVILTEVQWHECKRIISDAIEFGEACIGSYDESKTLSDLKAREQKLTTI